MKKLLVDTLAFFEVTVKYYSVPVAASPASYLSIPARMAIPITPPVRGRALSKIAVLQIDDYSGCKPTPKTFPSSMWQFPGQEAITKRKLAYEVEYLGPNLSLP